MARIPSTRGCRALEDLAGVWVKTKAVERVSQAIGKQIETIFQAERERALSGKVVPLKAVPKIYISIDGTGVPMVACDTEGRKERINLARPRLGRLSWDASLPRPSLTTINARCAMSMA